MKELMSDGQFQALPPCAEGARREADRRAVAMLHPSITFARKVQDEGVTRKRCIVHKLSFRRGYSLQRREQLLQRVLDGIAVNNHAILRPTLVVGKLLEAAGFGGAVGEGVVIGGLEFAGGLRIVKEGSHFPVLRQVKTDSSLAVTSAGKVEEQLGEVQEGVLRVQNTGKRTLLIGMDGVRQLQSSARSVCGPPGVSVNGHELTRLAITTGLDVLNISNEIANLVKSIPSRKLYLQRRPCIRHGYGHQHQVRSGLAKVEQVIYRCPGLCGA